MTVNPGDLRPGDIGFGPIGGAVGLLVGAGQVLLGDATGGTFGIRHVFVVTDAATAVGPFRTPARIVQAMPHGAELVPLENKHFTEEHVFIRPEYAGGKPYEIGIENRSQGFLVAKAARKYVGTPYSFLDYVALAGLHFGIKNGPIRRYVTTSRHMICSQLADQSMSDAGWHVFDDGRLPQDVTPAELFSKMMTMPGQFFRPHRSEWRNTI